MCLLMNCSKVMNCTINKMQILQPSYITGKVEGCCTTRTLKQLALF